MVEMTTPTWSLLILGVVGLLLIGGLIMLIVLLANEKTRVAGLVLLAVMLLGFGGLVAAGAAAVFYMRLSHQEPPAVQEFQIEASMPPMEEPPPPPMVEPPPPPMTIEQAESMPDTAELTEEEEMPAEDASTIDPGEEP